MNQDVHDALCFALWHHQGGSSTIGQPIRKMLDLGPHDYMDEDEIKGAKRVLGLLYPQQRDSSATPRTWIGLTYDERVSIIHENDNCSSRELCERIEAALKRKNNYDR